jgi:hypothetical protein
VQVLLVGVEAEDLAADADLVAVRSILRPFRYVPLKDLRSSTSKPPRAGTRRACRREMPGSFSRMWAAEPRPRMYSWLRRS